MAKNTFKLLSIVFITLTATFLLFSFSLLDTWQERIFDAFFTKKTAPSNIIILAIDNESIASIGQWPWSREVFAKVIGQLQQAKVIGIDVNFSEASITDGKSDATLAQAIANSKPKVVLPLQVNEKTLEKVAPLPILQRNALLGLVNVTNDNGVVRTVENLNFGVSSFGSVIASQVDSGITVPKTMRIDYYGPEKTFPTLSVSDFLNKKIPSNIFNDAIVLVGATAPDLHDFSPTPFGLLPGVEVHANSIATLLNQKFYQPLPWYAVLTIILLCDIVAMGLIIKIKQWYLLVGSLIASLLVINIVAVAFFSMKILFPVLYVNVGFLTAVAALVLYQYIFESKEKRFIYHSFKYYLAPEVISQLLQNPDKLQLGGERKKLTMLFSDIRGFTSISETMTPEKLTHILNEYLTQMTDIIMEEKGLVDKYIGDAVMAFWGAPVTDDNQAAHACQAAIAMVKALDKLNGHWKETGTSKELHIGMGINTGEVVVGNFGSHKRFNYTVLGDEVNLAARLEGLNKAYGTSIIIAQATKKEIEKDSRFFVRELDTILVKGKKEPKTIFELMVNPLPKELLECFNRGSKLYKKGEWQAAMIEFSKSAKEDPVSRMYFERCQEFTKNPPENWNGVYEFKTK